MPNDIVKLDSARQALSVPRFPLWSTEPIQKGGTVTKQQFEDAALEYASKGPKDEGRWRYKGPFSL